MGVLVLRQPPRTSLASVMNRVETDTSTVIDPRMKPDCGDDQSLARLLLFFNQF